MELTWGRDPERKKKEVRDLLDSHERLVKKELKTKFVTDSHERIPPIDLETFEHLLMQLTEDMTTMKEFLPKIVDMRTEVIYTADTVKLKLICFI